MARINTTDSSCREESCRKHIAKFLSLSGFQDDDPRTTSGLSKIKDPHKKLSYIRKTVFKRGGSNSRTSVVVQQHPRMAARQSPHTSEPPVIVAAAGGSDDTEYGRSVELTEFIKEIGGTEVKLVIEKKLYKTDITSNQGRLLIPELRIKNRDFLTRDEKNTLEDQEPNSVLLGEKKKASISVWVFDEKGRKYELNLAQWNMKSTNNYVLKTNWNQVVKANGLEEDMVIRLLSFRVDRQLCFAVAVI